MRLAKKLWQQNQRRSFIEANGFSTRAHYATDGQRQRILERDNYQCRACGMSDAEHRAKWNRPITIDHVNRDRSDNSDKNLQTLCLSCHGRKDNRIASTIEPFRDQIIRLRQLKIGDPTIARMLGFSQEGIRKFRRKWRLS